MGHQRSRAGFVGLSAAAAAFAAAAMLSAATAPTARAGPFTDITNDVQDELVYAQTAFSDAATYFSPRHANDAIKVKGQRSTAAEAIDRVAGDQRLMPGVVGEHREASGG